MPKKKEKVIASAAIPKALMKRLDDVAERKRWTRSQTLRVALEEFVERHGRAA